MRLLSLLLAVQGCYSPLETSASSRADAGASRGPGSDAGRGVAPPEGDLPCDVAALLQSRCSVCHDGRGGPPRLLSRDDLVQPSRSTPTRKLGEVALERMKSGDMPPDSPTSAEEIAVLETWLADGAPRGSCGAPDAGRTGEPEPKSVCTSGRFWNSGKKGFSMRPGKACIQCHEQDSDEGRILDIGGTVYPTIREPDLCYGVDGTSLGAEVVIVDARGEERRLSIGATGNFGLEERSGIAFPIRAKVVYQGRERVMRKAQDTGDCNLCHTETGSHGAPGRIVLP